MSPPSIPKILIVTAGFGDGHNSAARNLATALKGKAQALVIDPCALGAPNLNEVVRSVYRRLTVHSPALWDQIYRSTDRRGFRKELLALMRKPERAFRDALDTFNPDAIVSTYPLYPYFAERAFSKGTPRCPVFTVITDSIEINSSWSHAPTDYWLITDRFTQEILATQELSPDRLILTGFPVSPKFETLPPLPIDTPTDPFRILFCPTSRHFHTNRFARAILENPQTHLTVVLGRNVRPLYSTIKKIKLLHPNRVKIKGWTRKIPELLTSHHILVGKAGGATAHEAIAAACPMLIHHIIPGQEIGNLSLLTKLGGGNRADSPTLLKKQIDSLLANDAQLWKTMKTNLLHHRHPQAASTAAKEILLRL